MIKKFIAASILGLVMTLGFNSETKACNPVITSNFVVSQPSFVNNFGQTVIQDQFNNLIVVNNPFQTTTIATGNQIITNFVPTNSLFLQNRIFFNNGLFFRNSFRIR